MNAQVLLNRFDSWLEASGPVAVVIRENLMPVEGDDAVFFPPTFAPPQKGTPPGYVIDDTGEGKVAIVDTVGAQANRLEPLFKKEPLAALVPKATVKVKERRIELLDAGHRAADAVVRFSDKQQTLRAAFQAIADKGDAAPLAKLAPTSLVFGCWDSRDTQVKLPRVVGSRIRAYDVAELTRSAQYFASFEKDETEELKEELGLSQDALSELGFSDAPAGRSAGGVIARKGIRRDATLNLIALRALGSTDAETTLKLQRYILGLALLALLSKMELYLREGCLLVPANGGETKIVYRDNSRKGLDFGYVEALDFARAAAQDFGVGPAWDATFSKEAAKEALGATKSAKGKKGK
jgi:CRISPR-associated protein Csb1